MEISSKWMDEHILRMTVTLEAAGMADRIKKATIMVAHLNEITPDPTTTPLKAVEAKLGVDEAQASISEQIMKNAAPFALTDARIDIIGAPTFVSAHEAKKQELFTFVMDCVVVPTFELSSYDPVHVTMPPLAVSEDEVQAEIDALAEEHAAWETDDEKKIVTTGDVVEISMETVKDGQRVSGLCRDASRYNTGSFTMPDAFDEAIIGMKPGETREVVYSGPSFERDAEGNPIMEEYKSSIQLVRILKKVRPTVTDVWVSKSIPGCSSVKEFEDKVRSKLEKQIKEQEDKQLGILAVQELAKRFDEKIPDTVYEAAMEEAKLGFASKLEEEGTKLEDFLSQEGVDEQQLTISLMMQVRDQLVRQFSLNAYAKHIGLELDNADLEAFYETISPGMGAQARMNFEKAGRSFAAERAALRLKANRILVERRV